MDEVLLASCRWMCGPPQGPSTPFAGGDITFYDCLRVVSLAAVAVTVVLTVVAVRRAATVGQRVRFLGSAGLAIVVAATELEHLGDEANWRLAVSLISTVAMAWGTYAALRLETPSQAGWPDPPDEHP